MAIISDYEEKEEIPKPKKPSSSSAPSSSSSAKPSQFNANFDPSNPLGFLEKVFDFLANETDFLSRDRVEKDIETVVRRAVEKRKKQEESLELKGKAEKRIKEEARSVKQEVKAVKEEPTTVPSPPEEKVGVKLEEHKEGEKKEENGPRGEHSSSSTCLFFIFPICYLCWIGFIDIVTSGRGKVWENID